MITTGTAPECRQHGADVDVVEFLELEPVDGDDRRCRASSPRAGECRARPPTSPSPASTRSGGRARARRRVRRPRPAEGVEALERRRAAPGHEHRDRVSPSPRSSRRSTPLIAVCDRCGIDRVAVESARLGAITGTLRSGSASIGDTKIVLPLTCVVYCEAPTTVARMPSFAAFELRSPAFDPRADFLRQQRAEIAEAPASRP